MVQSFTKHLGMIALVVGFGTMEAQNPQPKVLNKWSPAGPVYTAGRARNMVVDKNDASGKTLYVGSTSSGVFKSTDAGANWNALDDQGDVRNISYMAQGPNGIIYAATGEGFLRTGQKASALPGTGLYKLVNDQLQLVADSSKTGRIINRIAISPANSSYLALTGNLGVLISKDGGQNWSPAANVTNTANLTGLDVKFDGNGILYCSIGSETGTGANAITTASKIYKSTDNTLSSFTNITPTASVLSDNNHGRIELAVAPSNNNVIYASIANKNPLGNSASASTLKALFVSYDAGSNWAMITQGSAALDPLSTGYIASGDYAHTLLVNPNNSNQLFFGGFYMYIFTRTPGVNGDSDSNPIGKWTQVGLHFAPNTQLYLHENIHDIKIIPGTPTKFYFVTDAGIYRSIDMQSVDQNTPPTFQPFYKGLITGQFNSVSIHRYPTAPNSSSAGPGEAINALSGFIGGTGANGMTYFSGTSQNVSQESNYLTGDVYNTELSKILPDAAFASTGNGNIYRSTNVKNSQPSLLKINKYTGALSKIAPNPEDFSNVGVNTGTPFKLWEWYGQTPSNPDVVYFYNDSARFLSSTGTVAELTTRTNFTWTAIRPTPSALIDSIVIRTGTVNLPVSGLLANSPGYTSTLVATLKLPENYANTGSLTVFTGTNLSQTGPLSGTEQPTVTLDNKSLNDQISITYDQPPFATRTQTNANVNFAGYYKVFATIYYKYKAGDQVVILDNSISTKPQSYTVTIPTDLRWKYDVSTLPSYTVGTTKNAALTNPTFVISPDYGADTSYSTPPVFTVTPIGVKSFTIRQYGDYTVAARPVVYTLTAATDTNVSGSTYTYVLTPGPQTKTALATAAGVSFTVSPAANTVYTITQSGSGTLTAESTYTVNATNYVLTPGNVSQATNIFTINVPPGAATTTYVLAGVSSNTALGASTTTQVVYPVQTVHNNIGSAAVPFSATNPRVKTSPAFSARLAMALNNAAITGGADAVVVSKNPLALNDPMSFVRISQNGAYTDDASGAPTFSTINVDGRPTVLEWSKSGTELYYATDQNKLYRVSHITEINDLSPTSYNGKFYTGIFQYNPTGNPNSSKPNPESPYRTTLIGSFDRPVTSISVNNNDSAMVVTLSNAAGTSTAGSVLYSGQNIKTTNADNMTWQNKTGSLTGLTIYCSLVEMGDNKRVLVGTNKGLYYTHDITAGNWTNAIDGQTNPNEQFPNVQVFDIEQQTMAEHLCYNSGQIYVATFGRGVWTNTAYLESYVVGQEEYAGITEAEESRLSIFPNPATSEVNISFTGVDGEKAVIQVMDLSGRSVNSIELDTLTGGENTHRISTSEMTPGVYIINVSSTSGVKRVAKLIVSK